MMFNQAETYLKKLEGEILKQVGDFKYLGLWIADSTKDIEVIIGLALKALSKLGKYMEIKTEKRT